MNRACYRGKLVFIASNYDTGATSGISGGSIHRSCFSDQNVAGKFSEEGLPQHQKLIKYFIQNQCLKLLQLCLCLIQHCFLITADHCSRMAGYSLNMWSCNPGICHLNKIVEYSSVNKVVGDGFDQPWLPSPALTINDVMQRRWVAIS